MNPNSSTRATVSTTSDEAHENILDGFWFFSLNATWKGWDWNTYLDIIQLSPRKFKEHISATLMLKHRDRDSNFVVGIFKS